MNLTQLIDFEVNVICVPSVGDTTDIDATVIDFEVDVICVPSVSDSGMISLEPSGGSVPKPIVAPRIKICSHSQSPAVSREDLVWVSSD